MTRNQIVSRLKSHLPLICGLASGLIFLALWRSYGTRFSAAIPNFHRSLELTSEAPANGEAAEIPPPVDLTVGDFGDISKVRRDHPLLQQGRAADLNPRMNDTRFTGEKIMAEFSNMEERLRALEQRK
jgi:hypothetical protein